MCNTYQKTIPNLTSVIPKSNIEILTSGLNLDEAISFPEIELNLKYIF